jgi:hypothetical protein
MLECGCDTKAKELMSGTDVDPLSLPLTQLGVGASKICYELCPKHVLKITFRWYMSQHQGNQEIEFWLTSTNEIKRFLAPIVAYRLSKEKRPLMDDDRCKDLGWIVQEKADTTWYKKEFTENGRYQNLLMERADISRATNLDDLYGDNLGLLNGRLVVIDYGYNTGRM